MVVAHSIEVNLLAVASSLLVLGYFFTRYLAFFSRVGTFSGTFLKDKIAGPTSFKFTPAAQGYPDQGNGIYADKLDFIDWFKFNSSQRVHQNFTEWLPIFLITCWLCSLVFPTIAYYFAFFFVLARLIYTIGYKLHPGSRVVGSLMFILGSMVLLIIVVVGYYMIFHKRAAINHNTGKLWIKAE